jgi:hypothetical protein
LMLLNLKKLYLNFNLYLNLGYLHIRLKGNYQHSENYLKLG